ncbi:MAG: phosphatidylcholine/phosphatidylserine synthase [Simkaniaceae bacterium]
MKQVNLLPNIVTAFGLACGLYVIFKINLTAPGFGTFDVLFGSALLMLVAALADVLDGAIARAIRAESEFGFMFDSLADAITFGVAPSVLMLKSLSLEQGSLLSFFAVIGAMLYSICGVLRLVRFNVKGHEVQGNSRARLLYKKTFTGLPIPAGALAAVSINLFLTSAYAKEWFDLSQAYRASILTAVMILLGYLMVCRLKFPSLKTLHMRVASFHIIFVTVIAAIFLLYGILHHFPLVFALISWGYIAFSLILSLIQILRGNKKDAIQSEDDTIL